MIRAGSPVEHEATPVGVWTPCWRRPSFAIGRWFRWGSWTAGLAALFAVYEAAPAQRFETVLWVNDGVEQNAELFSAIRALGFSAITISAEQDPSAPGRHGLRFYRDQVAGKGVLELREGPWSEQRAKYEASRDPRDLVRPSCLSESTVLEGCREVLRRRLAAALPHGPFAASLGDEISVTRHNNPLDFCFSPSCLRSFRSFVKRRHGGVAGANGSWGSAFVKMTDVVPFTADRIRARELGRELPRNLRPWSEHLEFTDEQLAGVVAVLRQDVAEMAPGLPCGLTGMQPPTAYGGHDYRRLMPLLDFYEAYDIGGARDLAMSLARPGAKQIATITPLPAGAPLALVRGRVFDMVAHGMSGLVVWSAREVFGSGAEPTDYGRELARVFASLRPAADVTAGATVQRSSVWIVESQASVRAHWMLDSAADGRTWIRRLSSYEHVHSTSLAARHSWVRMFEDLGMQPRLVPVEELAARMKSGHPQLLVLPALMSVSDAAAATITEYVNAGGTAVADHGLGLYDGSLRRRQTGVLDELFGVRGRSFDMTDLVVRQGRPTEDHRLPSGAAVAEPGLDGELAEPAGAHRVHIENRHGEGRTIYLNLAVCEYGGVRLERERVRTALDLRRRVRRVAYDAGLRPPVVVHGAGLPTCIERLELRAPGGRRVLAIRVNALENRELMQQLYERGPREITLSFPAEVHLADLISGRDLGTGTEFTMTFGSWMGLLLEVLP